MKSLVSIFGFLSFGWADVLDILMVATIIFFLIRSIRADSTVLNIVLVLVALLVLQGVVSALNMRMMTVLLNTLLDVGVLALIILFQPEIRHMLNRLAVQSGLTRRTGELFNRIMGIKEEKMGSESAEELGEAVRAMSAEKTGALIVLQHKSSMEEYMNTGDRFEADINRRLITNIFFKNSPLHDGAMIIIGDHIAAARCQLPMTNRTDIPAHYGMRHRAAIGLTEDTDADVLVVSEETGNVSFVRGGEITTVNDVKELRQLLQHLFRLILQRRRQIFRLRRRKYRSKPQRIPVITRLQRGGELHRLSVPYACQVHAAVLCDARGVGTAPAYRDKARLVLQRQFQIPGDPSQILTAAKHLRFEPLPAAFEQSARIFGGDLLSRHVQPDVLLPGSLLPLKRNAHVRIGIVLCNGRSLQQHFQTCILPADKRGKQK